MGARQKTTRQIPGQFLRHIWKQRLFSGEDLRATDGRRIEVLSPGRLNYNRGPDFIDACIRIGDLTYCGDIELHRNFSDWTHRSHPSYNAVILQVVFNSKPGAPPPVTKSNRKIPVLVLNRAFQLYKDYCNRMSRSRSGGFVDSTHPLK